MKKIILMGTLVSALMGSTAMAMPDELLSATPAGEITNEKAIVSAYNEKTQMAVEDFARAWANTRMHISEAKAHKAEGKMTITDEAWLQAKEQLSFAKRFSELVNARVEFYKFMHNWNGKNKNDRHYSYETLPGSDKEGKYVNSYGYDVLKGLAEALSRDLTMLEVYADRLDKADIPEADIETTIFNAVDMAQVTVANEELRHYMNEMVWFAAKQTLKELDAYVPVEAVKAPGKIDLWKAIQ